MIQHWAGSQLWMNSIERLEEYATQLPRELQGQAEPPAYWPSNVGGIDVNDLAVRYRDDLPLAVKGISFSVRPGVSVAPIRSSSDLELTRLLWFLLQERVAIVGRTGSGKSTLALAFFRFIEAVGGSIVIDGLNISEISLTILRERLTIIPQDTSVFAGTVRYNLDPFDQHSDAE